MSRARAAIGSSVGDTELLSPPLSLLLLLLPLSLLLLLLLLLILLTTELRCSNIIDSKNAAA